MEVAWRYTKEEIAAWRAEQEELTPPPRPRKGPLDNYFNAK